MIHLSAKNPGWVPLLKEAVHFQGAAIVEGVLDSETLKQTKDQLFEVQKKIIEAVGTERLQKAGELGVLRLMMKYSPFFLRFIEIPQVLETVDLLLSPTAILHLQNGFILPTFPKDQTPPVFQNRFHMDFPRFMNGYLTSINTFFAIDEFTKENGATLLSPGTHQHGISPSREYLEQTTVQVECPPGSMLVFDSTLWHAAGINFSGKDRLAINQQFTRSFIKQQIDYVRALGLETLEKLPERTKQLLGWYTRVVTSLDEYYQPPEKRLYRAGQG